MKKITTITIIVTNDTESEKINMTTEVVTTNDNIEVNTPTYETIGYIEIAKLKLFDISDK